MAADGSIILDTSIDTSGITKGAKKIASTRQNARECDTIYKHLTKCHWVNCILERYGKGQKSAGEGRSEGNEEAGEDREVCEEGGEASSSGITVP